MYWRWRWRLSPLHDIYYHLYLHLNSLQLLETSEMEKLSNNGPLQHHFEPIGDHGDGNWTPHYMIHLDLHNHLNPLHATILNHWRWRSWTYCMVPLIPISIWTYCNHIQPFKENHEHRDLQQQFEHIGYGDEHWTPCTIHISDPLEPITTTLILNH